MCIASCYARRIDILDNPRRNAGCRGTVGRGESPLSQSVVDILGNTRFSMIKSGCFPVCSIAVKPFDAVW